jgi:GntR family uxuAB operon transcriptional repressor
MTALELSPRDVAALLETELVTARSRSNGRLASERELTQRFGVSRGAVRRWLDDLERAQKVSRHVGRGTFLTSPQPDAMETSPAEIMTVRLMFEPPMLALAIANATAGDIAGMRQWLADGEAAPTYEDFERCDSGLHASIAGATHNRLLIQLFESVNAARDHSLWGSVKRRSFTPERRAQYETDHRALVDAIDDRDTERATALMRQHLAGIRVALLGVDN